jgi:hypothetical protein
MKSGKFSTEDSTFVPYKTNPAYTNLGNLKIVSTGTNKNLSSVYFVDRLSGYACGEGGTIIKTLTEEKTG